MMYRVYNPLTYPIMVGGVTIAPSTSSVVDIETFELKKLRESEVKRNISYNLTEGDASDGLSAAPSNSITRPADTTAYASGDLVANSTTSRSVTPINLAVARGFGGTGMVRRVILKKSTTGVTSASFRVHLYGSAPTVTNGDNGAWLSTESGYMGYLDVTMDRVFSNGASGIGAPATGSEILFATAANSASIYALIEARGAYTPGNAEVFTVVLEVMRD